MRFKQFLLQPIRTFNTAEKKWIYIISSIVFAVLFILIYKPFGIAEEMEKPTTSLFRIAAFVGTEGLSIGIVLYLFQFKLLKYSPFKTMSLKKFINLFLLQMLCISILHNTLDTILVYKFFPEELMQIELEDLNDSSFNDETPLNFFLDCILSIAPQIFILSYPLMGCLLYFYVSDLKEEVSELECELNKFKINYLAHQNNQETLELLDENNQTELTLGLDQLIALESNNQYVLIYYFDLSKNVSKQIIRTRLKKLLNELEHTPIIQCHRSYAVNLLNVAQLKNIDKKSVLTISDIEQLKIPVSKTYLSKIKERLKQNS